MLGVFGSSHFCFFIITKNMSMSIDGNSVNFRNFNTVGERIRFYRKRAELSQVQLEILAGIATGTITRIERNAIDPTKETIAKIGVALSLDTREMAYLYEINLYKERKNKPILNKIDKKIKTKQYGIIIRK
jgi:transcriptional regulator with XRE-family HTH domain